MAPAPDNTLDELLARMRRIETRVHRMCEKLGVDMASAAQVVVGHAPQGPFAEIKGYDVTLSKIARELSIGGVDPYAEQVNVVMNGKIVATINFVEHRGISHER